MNSDAVFPSVSFHDDLDIYRLILRLEIGVPVCLNVYLQGIGALLQLSRDPDLSLLLVHAEVLGELCFFSGLLNTDKFISNRTFGALDGHLSLIHI